MHLKALFTRKGDRTSPPTPSKSSSPFAPKLKAALHIGSRKNGSTSAVTLGSDHKPSLLPLSQSPKSYFKNPYTPQNYDLNSSHAGPSPVSPTLERVKARQQRSCAPHRPVVLQKRRPNTSLPTIPIDGPVSSSLLNIPFTSRVAHSSPATTLSNTSSYSLTPAASAENYDPFIASPTLVKTPRSDPPTPSSTTLMTPRSSLLLAPSTPSATSHLIPFGLPTPPLTPSRAVANTPSEVSGGLTKAVVQHAKTGLLQKATVPAFTPLPQGHRERPKSGVTTPAASPSRGRTTHPLTPTTPLRLVAKSKSTTTTTALEGDAQPVSTQGLGLILDSHPIQRTLSQNPPALPSEPSTLPWPTFTPTAPLRLTAKAPRADPQVGGTQSPKATIIHGLESTFSPQHTPSASTESERNRLRNLELETLVFELSMKLDTERARSAGFEKRIEELEATASSAELSPVNFAVGILRAVPKDRRCCRGFTKTLRTGIRALSTAGRKKHTGPRDKRGEPSAYSPLGGNTSGGSSDFIEGLDALDQENTLQKALKDHALLCKTFDNEDSDVELE
ncbi:hypothetical protein FRB90_011793 [Tulasnella sp. 427]|nr:hypothetical protein FRB90_011793 [Tulasnella sp. 427]